MPIAFNDGAIMQVAFDASGLIAQGRINSYALSIAQRLQRR